MKQTSIEWLIRNVNENIAPKYIPKEVAEQAKEMHKEEIIKAWKMGDGKYDITADEMSLGYYKKTFKGGNK